MPDDDSRKGIKMANTGYALLQGEQVERCRESLEAAKQRAVELAREHLGIGVSIYSGEQALVRVVCDEAGRPRWARLGGRNA